MKTYNFNDVLASESPITPLDCSVYPDCTVPDLNIDLYDMLVRQQSGDITTIGGMLRRDAHYSTPDDIKDMRVALENDPEFNLITAKYYAEHYNRSIQSMIEDDQAEAQRSKSESEPSEPHASELSE